VIIPGEERLRVPRVRAYLLGVFGLLSLLLAAIALRSE
jgi:hypothetical protein